MPAAAPGAAHDVLRYFTLAAPAHHEDERHLVPLLRASADAAARDAAARLLRDHVEIRAAWETLQPLLHTLAAGALPELGLLRRAVERFVDLHRPHLQLEDEVAFPLAERELARRGSAALSAIGNLVLTRNPSVSLSAVTCGAPHSE